MKGGIFTGKSNPNGVEPSEEKTAHSDKRSQASER